MRRTYHYDEATRTMVEGPAPARGASPSIVSDRLYSDRPFRGHDGTLIDSRRKHRDYLKRHNLTTADDFKEVWKEKAEERAKFFKEGDQREERRADVLKAVEKLRG